ncbi:MAG TPA: plastocyanin/azurin family copper-binding protein [Sporichthyaceae bacterium]|jgi:plastocyanin
MKMPATAAVVATATVFSLPFPVAAGTVPGGKPVPVQTVQVSQKFIQFNPTDLKINTGDTVVWTNHETDDTTHSVVQDNGDEIDSPDIPPGSHFVWKFDFPGEWDIVCRFHPAMFLTVHVLGKAVPGAKVPVQQHHHTRAPAPAKPSAPDGSTIPGVTGLPIAVHRHPHR